MARLPESGGHPYDATGMVVPRCLRSKPTPAQLSLNVSKRSARGPLTLRFATDDRAGHRGVVLTLAAETGGALLP